MTTTKRSYFLTSSAVNFSGFITLRCKIWAVWMNLTLNGTQTGPVYLQLSFADSGTLQVDPSGIQYSDSVFAFLVCRANLTGNSPMAVSQQFLYRTPVVSERGFGIYTSNGQSDTFSLAITLEYSN